MHAVMEQVFHGVNLTPKTKSINDQGENPELLKLHSELDVAAAGAYGWSASLTTDEILTRLLKLNRHGQQRNKPGQSVGFVLIFKTPSNSGVRVCRLPFLRAANCSRLLFAAFQYQAVPVLVSAVR